MGPSLLSWLINLITSNVGFMDILHLPSGYLLRLLHSHGIDGPFRNRWFTLW